MAPTSSPGNLPEMPKREQDGEGDGRLNSDKNKRNTISEMKRINALNLEPTLPKPDDSQKNRMSFKEQNARGGPQRSSDLKQEFQQSLSTIKTQQASKDRKQRGETSGSASSDAKPAANAKAGFQNQPFNPPPSKGSFNSSLSPQAAEFKPKPAGAVQSAPNQGQASGPSPLFEIKKCSEKSLPDLITPFFDKVVSVGTSDSDPKWSDANGPSYRDVLQVDKGAAGGNAGPPMMGGPQGGNRGPGGPAPNQWQPPAGGMQPNMQGQTAPGQGNPQQMMPGFVMAGPGGPNGVQTMMYPGQGYPGQAPGGPQGNQQGGMGQNPQGQPPQNMMMMQQGMMGQGQPGMQGQQMMPMGMMMPQGGPQGQQMMAMMPMQGNQSQQQGQQQMMMMPMMMAPGGQGNMPQGMVMMPQGMQGQMQPGQMQPGQMMQQQMPNQGGG